MGVKEDLFRWAFDEGINRIQKRVDVETIQQKYGATKEKVLKFVVDDVNVEPVYIMVKDGEILKLDAGYNVDVTVRFKHLDRFLDVILIDGALERIFAYDGCVLRGGRLVKEVWIEGDWLGGSIMLKRVFEEYVRTIREVLHESKFFKVVVKPSARMKRIVHR